MNKKYNLLLNQIKQNILNKKKTLQIKFSKKVIPFLDFLVKNNFLSRYTIVNKFSNKFIILYIGYSFKNDPSLSFFSIGSCNKKNTKLVKGLKNSLNLNFISNNSSRSQNQYSLISRYR